MSSEELFQAARQFIPGGVSRNTVYRAPNPDYFEYGNGSRVTDRSGVTRIDFANNMASLIHGHAFPPVVQAVCRQMQKGSAATMAMESEFLLARLLCQRVPWFEMIRFMNSGTEAVMAAIKCARAVTGKTKIARAEGVYHGTYDFAEVSQNVQPDDWGERSNPASVAVAHGTPPSVLDQVVVFPFNDVQRTIQILERNAEDLACVLLDLVPHRAGLAQAGLEYVQTLHEWTRRNQCLLVFDEVISFRFGIAGAAGHYQCEPDLTTLGKIIGGGFPIGGLAGKNQFMRVMDPLADEYSFPWSGTFAANPITMTAGLVAMEHFDHMAIQQLNSLGEHARQSVGQVIEQSGLPFSVTGHGSMFRIHPRNSAITDHRSTWQTPDERSVTANIVNQMYDAGFLLFRTCTAALSTANNIEQIEQFCRKLKQVLNRIKDQ